jgi:hypothetical protein
MRGCASRSGRVETSAARQAEETAARQSGRHHPLSVGLLQRVDLLGERHHDCTP